MSGGFVQTIESIVKKHKQVNPDDDKIQLFVRVISETGSFLFKKAPSGGDITHSNIIHKLLHIPSVKLLNTIYIFMAYQPTYIIFVAHIVELLESIGFHDFLTIQVDTTYCTSGVVEYFKRHIKDLISQICNIFWKVMQDLLSSPQGRAFFTYRFEFNERQFCGIQSVIKRGITRFDPKSKYALDITIRDLMWSFRCPFATLVKSVQFRLDSRLEYFDPNTRQQNLPPSSGTIQRIFYIKRFIRQIASFV